MIMITGFCNQLLTLGATLWFHGPCSFPICDDPGHDDFRSFRGTEAPPTYQKMRMT